MKINSGRKTGTEKTVPAIQQGNAGEPFHPSGIICAPHRASLNVHCVSLIFTNICCQQSGMCDTLCHIFFTSIEYSSVVPLVVASNSGGGGGYVALAIQTYICFSMPSERPALPSGIGPPAMARPYDARPTNHPLGAPSQITGTAVDTPSGVSGKGPIPGI